VLRLVIMKKLIINIIALTGLLITVIATGCSIQRHPKQVHNYSSNRYHHYGHRDYDGDHEHRYAPPRQY